MPIFKRGLLHRWREFRTSGHFCDGQSLYTKEKLLNHKTLTLTMPATRHRIIAALERSSSESSIHTTSGTSYVATDSDASSSSPAPTAALALKQRRTRKRISPAQLAALEDLFSRTSHPSQQERDLLAKAIGMYVVFSSLLLPPMSV